MYTIFHYLLRALAEQNHTFEILNPEVGRRHFITGLKWILNEHREYLKGKNIAFEAI